MAEALLESPAAKELVVAPYAGGAVIDVLAKPADFYPPLPVADGVTSSTTIHTYNDGPDTETIIVHE